jgi:hypothetical protein
MNDRYLFLDNKFIAEMKIIESFTLSSSFTQTFIKKDESIMASFEGTFIKYNHIEKKIKSEKNILNFLPNELKQKAVNNYQANPPYINHCSYNPLRDEIYFCLLNGVIVNLKNNLKTNFVKLIHSSMIKDLKVYNTMDKNFLLSLGKEKCLKIVNLDDVEIKMSIDLSDFSGEDPTLIESNTSGTIVYCTSNSQNLKLIKLNN